jgi:hypothetical protein
MNIGLSRFYRFAIIQRVGAYARPLFIAGCLASTASASMGPLVNQPPKGTTPEQVIQRFAAKEAQFKTAREHYTYNQEVKIQTLDGSTVDGEYKQSIEITFDDKGRRIEKVLYAPAPTLVRVQMTREDIDDIEKRLPFVLTTEDLPDYNILYVGQQRVDELDTYVFDVAPKKIEKNKRYFQGRIFVDQQDMQIVLTDGKTVPEIRKKSEENLFPSFVTYREQVDGKYWFPTYTKAEDNLHFSSGDVHIREIVKYTNYKRFGSDVKIIFDGKEVKSAPDAKQSNQTKK